MAANTLTAPSISGAELRREPIEERIWRNADALAVHRMWQAMDLRRRKGETATPQNAIDLARSLQLKDMRDADTDNWPLSLLTANKVTLLMLGIPSAARAQTRLDEHRSHDRRLDVASLSRFNDDFTGALADMPRSMMPDFTDGLMRRSHAILQDKWHLPILSEKQFDRIANGLAHEVAVWRGLSQTLPEDWSIRQGSTQEDLHGTDFVVYNPEGRELRLDVKSRVAFDYAVNDLEAGRWIPSHVADQARESGVVYSRTRVPGSDDVFTCVFDADMLGGIENYEYKDPSTVFDFVERQFQEQGQTRLRKLGNHAINK